MLEVFAGGAVLTSVAKQFGLGGMAIDKTRKQNARCTIYQLDLLQADDRELLEEWLSSPLLLWAHFAPVCGTASRAREIPRPELSMAPRPLRSMEYPMGLPDLGPIERKRVEIANELFRYTCQLFAFCVKRGVLATMENPRGSYLWMIPFLVELQRIYPLFATDFQACMYGSERDKWTRIVASFPEITQMDVTCDRKHKHLGWGFTTNAQGQKVWATSEESQYPRKLCIALVQVVLQVASAKGVLLRPNCIHDIVDHPLCRPSIPNLLQGFNLEDKEFLLSCQIFNKLLFSLRRSLLIYRVACWANFNNPCNCGQKLKKRPSSQVFTFFAWFICCRLYNGGSSRAFAKQQQCGR